MSYTKIILSIALSMIVPNFVYAQESKVTRDQFTILSKTRFKRQSSIFPKSKVNNTVNPIFKKNSFKVQEIYTQDPLVAFKPKVIGYKPRAIRGQGTNNQFDTTPPPINYKDLPKGFHNLMKK